MRGASAGRRVSNSGERSSGSRRTCSDHSNVESHTIRFVGDTDHWTKLETGPKSAEQNLFEAWRQLATENAPKSTDRRLAMLQAVLQPGMSDNPAKFEETWMSWEYQVDVCDNLSSTKQDDDVKISVVLHEAHRNCETICW